MDNGSFVVMETSTEFPEKINWIGCCFMTGFLWFVIKRHELQKKIISIEISGVLCFSI